jgi:hypothetical protein
MLPEHETRITLTEAAKIAPGRPHNATLFRWCFDGCRGVRLEYERCGRRIFTTPEALRRFSRKLTAQDDRSESVEVVKPRSSRQREAAVSRAEHDLRQGGW